MGEQATKRSRSAWPITFDFTAPKLLIGRRDRELLKSDAIGGGDDDGTEVRAVKYVLASAVSMASVQSDGRAGFSGTDRAMMARWQEAAFDVSCDHAAVDRSMLDWLWERVNKDSLLTPPGQSQWFEAIKTYVRSLRDQPGPESPDGETP